ncbi:MAG: DUF3256 family protein [Muribaculaceae bacterium]|nr:DUF3256 family protein [Muribaculaceae bacterium]
MKSIMTAAVLTTAAALMAAAEPPAAADAAPDRITASDALVKMPAQTLDILSTSMRLDLLDYYRADSIYRVPNVMEGFSWLHRPLTDDYAKVQVTPVTTLTLKVLPWKKKQIVMSVYTIGDSLQAADSDIRFYDSSMRELDPARFIRLVTTEDFIESEGTDRRTRKELAGMIPFPTVEYTIGPDSLELRATLTSGTYLGKEEAEKLLPHLRKERTYRWTGSRFELGK